MQRRGPVEELTTRSRGQRVGPDVDGADERIEVRLDTDWYESTRHELEHLFPRLREGGVLIVDDYGHWQGARQAVDEFLAGLRGAR